MESPEPSSHDNLIIGIFMGLTAVLAVVILVFR